VKRHESRVKVLDYMIMRLSKGEPPTVREVQAAMGFRSVESARAHLDALVADGLLTKTPNTSRSFRLPTGASRPSKSRLGSDA
jgi:repressor LexA